MNDEALKEIEAIFHYSARSCITPHYILVHEGTANRWLESAGLKPIPPIEDEQENKHE